MLQPTFFLTKIEQSKGELHALEQSVECQTAVLLILCRISGYLVDKTSREMISAHYKKRWLQRF